MPSNVVALTGSPGTGKSTLARALAKKGIQVIQLEDIARNVNGIQIKDGIQEIETSKLPAWEWGDEQPCVIDGHLSHYCSIDAVIILRCHPRELRSRLKRRPDYSPEKITSNVEWELLGGIWLELVQLHPEIKVLEIDTTQQSIDIHRVKSFIVGKYDSYPSAEDFVLSSIDWIGADDATESI